MNKYRLVLNLQHFAADDIDWDSFDKEFESAMADDDTAEQQVDEPEEQADETTDEGITDDEPEQPESEGDPKSKQDQDKDPQPKDKPGPDEAFKRMRQELEQSKKFEHVIKEIAEQNGVTPEQLLEAYEQRKLEQQAKAQNTSPEILKRLQQLEAQNQQLTEKQMAERFNQQVVATKEKYKLTDDDIKTTLAEAQKQGFTVQDFTRLPFETIYKTVNADVLIQREIESARQRELEQQREIERTSTVPVTKGDVPKVNSEDDIADMVLRDLRESGDID